MRPLSPLFQQMFRQMSRRIALVAAAAFLLAFAAGVLLHRRSVLHDTDAYYHLAVARFYDQAASQGQSVDELPWVRLSLLGDGFGDKEWLFHVLLRPFAPSPRNGYTVSLGGGRLALALFGAVLAAALAALAVRDLGWWAALLPLWLCYASTELAWRLVRLRPELLSLLLLIAAVEAIGRRRDRLLGLVACLYTLSYTAFHALVGLAGLTFAWFAWKKKGGETPSRMLLYAVLGAGFGLLLHPHFPKNLEVWILQNVQFFLSKGVLDVGTEIRPNTSDVVLMVNLGWALGLAVLWRSGREDGAAEVTDEDHRRADVLAIATAVFGVLYLLMSRFSIYFFPFATLFCLAQMRRRGRRPGGPVVLPGGRRVPFVLAVALCLLVSLPEAWRQLDNYHRRTDPGPDAVRLKDREAFAAALPPGARVAADWGPTATYMLWAPQAFYLNALDPVFMATPYPDAHARLRAVVKGREPDVPAAAAELLSDHLAFPTVRGLGDLQGRLDGDPRVRWLHRGSQTLVRFVPAPGVFVIDWQVAPRGELGMPAGTIDGWEVYPRATDPWQRAVEGYVDGERVRPDDECAVFVRELTTTAQLTTTGEIELAFAPYAASTLWIDGEVVVEVLDEPRAFPGRGVRLRRPLDAGAHRLAVRTCEDATGEHKGFYLALLAPLSTRYGGPSSDRRGSPAAPAGSRR